MFKNKILAGPLFACLVNRARQFGMRKVCEKWHFLFAQVPSKLTHPRQRWEWRRPHRRKSVPEGHNSGSQHHRQRPVALCGCGVFLPHAKPRMDDKLHLIWTENSSLANEGKLSWCGCNVNPAAICARGHNQTCWLCWYWVAARRRWWLLLSGPPFRLLRHPRQPSSPALGINSSEWIWRLIRNFRCIRDQRTYTSSHITRTSIRKSHPTAWRIVSMC